ncbi:MAG: dihydroorotate dehydrogenase [archaeon]
MKLDTELAGIKLKNPTILASGILGNTGEILKRVATEGGAGAVTTKSIGEDARTGHGNATIVDMGKIMLNAMGLPNPGATAFVDEIKIAKEAKVPVIASIFGSSVEGYAAVAKKVLAAKPDMIEINMSCPHAKGHGASFGSDEETAGQVVKAVKKVSGKTPVFAKLTPNVVSISAIAKAVENAGADGITAINTLGPGVVIDVETASPVLSNVAGGLSGEAIKPIAVRCVYEIYKTVKIPIIGTGGVYTGLDAAEMLMAGASAVGIGTAVKDREIDVFSKICKELSDFMERKNYKSVKDLVGLAHRRIQK